MELSSIERTKLNFIEAIVFTDTESASEEVKTKASNALLKVSLDGLKAIWAVLSLKKVQ